MSGQKSQKNFAKFFSALTKHSQWWKQIARESSRTRRDVTVDVSTSVHVPSPAAVVLQTSNKPANVKPPGSSPFAEAPSASASASVPHASAGDQTAPRRSSSPAMGSVPTEQSREHCAVAWLHGLDSGVQCLRARSSGRARNESRVVLFRWLFYLFLSRALFSSQNFSKFLITSKF